MLTDAQRRALEMLSDGKRVFYWWWNGRMGQPSQGTRKALERKGLVEFAEADRVWRITPAGRKALEESND
jgi:hypothetical protein